MKRKLKYDDTVDNEVASKKQCLDDKKTEDKIDDDDESSERLDFDPLHFLRCHSRNNDVADVQTQVWHCAFEPQPNMSHRNTNIVATCGGNSVCFINVKLGEVIGKYYAEDQSERFYSVCWTTVRQNWMDKVGANIVAVGGIKNTIHLIHPQNMVAFLKLRMKTDKKTVINSLLFHPNQPSILFCGNSRGDVVVLDIGTPLPPEYLFKFDQLHIFSTRSEIFNLVFSVETGTLLAACNEGLCGWKLGTKDLKKMSDTPDLLEFSMPKKSESVVANQSPQLVDSVEVLGDGFVATKCALSGSIYVWSLKDTLNKPGTELNKYAVVPQHTLKWSDTDNYFMHIGYNRNAGLLACGDDKGALWLYDIRELLKGRPTTEIVVPTLILSWPTLIDVYVDKKRKLSLDVYDIVIDKVIVDFEGNSIVAVTNNNMVCVWERTGLSS